jgi:flavin reductase (DIM6/NTAB) family NADH-FMN oxidoreductase RutF
MPVVDHNMFRSAMPRLGAAVNLTPVLNDASVALDCRIASVREVGTHSVFFCEVEAVRIADRVEGLIYFNRAYHPIGERTSG